MQGSTAAPFSHSEKQALYKAIFSRRDVRSDFLKKKIPNKVLARILNAAHHAPSVGLSQPWNFRLIKDNLTRERVRESFLREREKSIRMLDNNKVRQDKYISLKLEGILESDLNICVTYDSTRFGPFVLGRSSIADTGVYSVCCAIQNLWLAARVEGIGVGWVSVLSNEDLQQILLIPEHVRPVAYLCLGYVCEFAHKPDLEKKRWLYRMELNDVVFYERWGQNCMPLWTDLCKTITKIKKYDPFFSLIEGHHR